MKHTTNFNLKKPDYTDPVDIKDINDNMDVIDDKIGILTTKVKPTTPLNTTSQDLSGAVNEINTEVSSHKADNATDHNRYDDEIVEIKKKIGIVHNIGSWKELQDAVRGGQHKNILDVGDQFFTTYNGTLQIVDVIGINHDIPTDTNFTNSLTLQFQNCLLNARFDAPEPSNPDANRQQYGNNRYIHSAIKQWLNSSEDSFTWVSQHEHDVAPTSANYTGAGFLKLLDPELTAVLGAVDKQVARNTVVDGGGQDLFSDKVFLLSRVEVHGGAEGDSAGEKAYPFYSALAPEPTTSELAGRIKLLGLSPRYWWLRSPLTGSSRNVRAVHTSGSVSLSYAHHSGGVSPACVII